MLPPFIPFPRPSDKQSYSRRIGRGTSSNQTYAALTGRESFGFDGLLFAYSHHQQSSTFSRRLSLPESSDAREQGLVVSASSANLSDRACFGRCLLVGAAPTRAHRGVQEGSGEECGPQGTAPSGVVQRWSWRGGCGVGWARVAGPDSERSDTRLRVRQRLASFRDPSPTAGTDLSLEAGAVQGHVPCAWWHPRIEKTPSRRHSRIELCCWGRSEVQEPSWECPWVVMATSILHRQQDDLWIRMLDSRGPWVDAWMEKLCCASTAFGRTCAWSSARGRGAAGHITRPLPLPQSAGSLGRAGRTCRIFWGVVGLDNWVETISRFKRRDVKPNKRRVDAEGESTESTEKRDQARGSQAPARASGLARGAQGRCSQSQTGCRHQGSSVTLGSDDQPRAPVSKRSTVRHRPPSRNQVQEKVHGKYAAVL